MKPLLRVSNRARCRRCSTSRCWSFPVSYWIISICRPIGGQIKLKTYTYYTSLLFETLSTGLYNVRYAVLRVLKRARCSRCRSVLVYRWMIIICLPKGDQIKPSNHTFYTSPFFETLSRGFILDGCVVGALS